MGLGKIAQPLWREEMMAVYRLSALFIFAVFLFSSTTQPIFAREPMHKEQTPQCLYKILSLRLWYATQNRQSVSLPGDDEAFIHLATEEQLERIIDKFWHDAPQFVILKLDVEKLTGELVYETNPGGKTRFYHLYNGFIPLNSILESKIVYRQPMHSEHSGRSSKALKLKIVEIGDPVLRTVARELTVEEILSPEIQQLIEDMKQTMRMAPGVGLAAPQIGKSLQIAVIEDMDHTFLTPEQIEDRDRRKVPFHVIINPRLYLEETEKPEFFEACLSVPHFFGVVPRARSVRVECLNERAEPVTIRGVGWYARILQHEIDHLNGHLFIDRAKLETMTTEENYVKLWKTKSGKEIKAALSSNKE